MLPSSPHDRATDSRMLRGGGGGGGSCHEFTKHNLSFHDSRNYKRIQKLLTQ